MSNKTLTDKVHSKFVYNRRLEVLCRHFAKMIPANARVLDVGCGDGNLDRMLKEKRPDITISGIDVFVRPTSYIEVVVFDGNTIPYGDNEFDVVMFVDVLHHTDDANVLLREAARVAKDCVIIKDHSKNGLLAWQTLRFMDNVGNTKHGVRLPYNYWANAEWNKAFDEVGLKSVERRTRLDLYPVPVDWIFGRGLHFIDGLKVIGKA